jgi:hypothetical protein
MESARIWLIVLFTLAASPAGPRSGVKALSYQDIGTVAREENNAAGLRTFKYTSRRIHLLPAPVVSWEGVAATSSSP